MSTLKLSSIDFLGNPIYLNIHGGGHKTIQGGIASIFLILISISAFFGFGRDILEKKQPKVTINKLINLELPTKNISDSNFLFAIYDQSTREIFSEFYRKFEIYYQYGEQYGNGTIKYSKKIFLVKCDDETLKKYEGLFKVEASNYVCLPKGSNVELKGIMNRGNFTYIRVQMDFCVNNTDTNIGPIKTNCFNKQQTKSLLSTKRIGKHYIIQSSLIDSLNFTSPGSSWPYAGIINTSVYSWTRLNIFFQKINIETDKGYLFEDKENMSYDAIETISPESVYSPDTATVFSHFLGNSPYIEDQKRSYIKIQDVFATMGGFISACLFILKIFLAYFLIPDKVNLFNQLYKYSYNKKDNSSHIKTLHSNIHLRNQFMNSFNNRSKKKEQDFKKLPLHDNQTFFLNSDIVKNNSDTENFKIKISLKLRIFRICRNKGDDFGEYYKIEKIYNKIFSFENFITLSKNYVILTRIILEDYQRYLINFTRFSINEEKNLEHYLENFKNSLQSKDSIVDKKLYEILTNHDI
jgi:hypothetical protein